jgi:hypothetical protein
VCDKLLKPRQSIRITLYFVRTFIDYLHTKFQSLQFRTTNKHNCIKIIIILYVSGHHRPIIREHTIVYKICLTFYAPGKAADNCSVCNAHVVDEVVK